MCIRDRYKGTATLKATVTPDTTTDAAVTWSSSNAKVASVNANGKVTAKKNGTANITAKTANGKTATCKVTVKSTVKLHSKSTVLQIKKNSTALKDDYTS